MLLTRSLAQSSDVAAKKFSKGIERSAGVVSSLVGMSSRLEARVPTGHAAREEVRQKQNLFVHIMVRMPLIQLTSNVRHKRYFEVQGCRTYRWSAAGLSTQLGREAGVAEFCNK